MKNLNKHDIEFLTDCLKNGKEIPEVYKYAIFPTKQKEYELVYSGKMRKEDVLADTEEAKPVPLQIEKIFNGMKYPLFSKDWHNLLIFGDNLQILKTFYENKDPLVKDKIKGKVKLIYIDPPFGTGDQYDANQGQRAYSAKKKGSDFVEFVRRRLIVAEKLLSDDGSLFIRIDYHFGHYIKVILDEVFGKENFRNEFVVRRGQSKAGFFKQFEKIRSIAISYDVVYWYSKNPETRFNKIYKEASLVDQKNGKWMNLVKSKSYKRPTMKYELLGINAEGPWMWSKERASAAVKNFRNYEKEIKTSNESLESYWSRTGEILEFVRRNNKQIQYWIPPREKILVDNDWLDIKGYDHITDYPTENSEELLNRIIQVTDRGDLVMDFFVGSGTTIAVAEKTGRRWIGCDIGKLSIYTIQKRLLEIDKSKDLENPKKKYGAPAKSFSVITAGLYDLGKIFDLQKEDYIRFVKDLFEIEEISKKTIGGVEISGKKRDFFVKIFPYWELKNASVDVKYLQELHKNIGKKIDGRFYIIAPANNVNFISDYHQIDDVRYYFLKVPYQIIKELHKVQFKKLRQPQSKNQINDLDEAIGFHFIRQPEVQSKIQVLKDKVILKIKSFESAYLQDETGEKLKNFESLSMLLVDLKYDGDNFMMTNYYFAQDLVNQKLGEEENDEEIKKELEKQKEITKEFPKKDCGKEILAIYVDIYGNEFKEVFKVK